jgi:hypothetical protein
MNLNFSTLKKVAKRNSARTGCAISEAQEGLAKDFGFRNFNAARKALTAADAAKPADGPYPDALWEPRLDRGKHHELQLGSGGVSRAKEGSAVWMGFSKGATYSLLEWLVVRRIASGEGRSWAEKGLRLLRVLLHELAEDGGVTAQKLHMAADIEWVERRCLSKREVLADEIFWTDPLVQYLGLLPGYEVQRLLTHGANDGRRHESAHENHHYRAQLVSDAMYELGVLEASGDDRVKQAILEISLLHDIEARERAGQPILDYLARNEKMR